MSDLSGYERQLSYKLRERVMRRARPHRGGNRQPAMVFQRSLK